LRYGGRSGETASETSARARAICRNRELAGLRRAFALAVKQRRIASAPQIDMLQENNGRQRFAAATDCDAIVDHLPEYLRDFARFAYASGWRKEN